MRTIILGFAALTVLSACTPEEEESVEDRFRRTEALIENTARDLEATTENAVRGMEAELENEADVFENHVDSMGGADGNQAETNASR